ncbi:vacuolar import/degradation protein Vid24 [Blastocladiella britannica]|nr:vacuolar import/degradation protein Vid24 [Blastocladiella britannica]
MGHGQPGALGALHPGAVFSGVQCSGTSRYGVSVAVQHVDADRGLAVAFLSISGLTDIHPVITTYLEAEIIGPHHAFTTGRWEADAEVDREHWSRFPEFEPLTDLLVSPTPAPAHVYDPVAAHDVVFMRWKELFLVPDHSQTSIEGASFSGFYYVALDLTAGTITGYYYSAASTWFQRLDLDYMPTDVGMPSYGFM